MTAIELNDLLKGIQKIKAETQNLEIKSAEYGCPSKNYDTLSSFLNQDEGVFVSAEIPGLDIAERPCFYAGKGRLKGSYVRIGDADEPMTEYEIYSYEAFIMILGFKNTHFFESISDL